jgi:hypothetical protein
MVPDNDSERAAVVDRLIPQIPRERGGESKARSENPDAAVREAQVERRKHPNDAELRRLHRELERQWNERNARGKRKRTAGGKRSR